MPKFTKDNLTIETNLPREAARLRSEGFREVKAEKPKPANSDAGKSAGDTKTTK